MFILVWWILFSILKNFFYKLLKEKEQFNRFLGYMYMYR